MNTQILAEMAGLANLTPSVEVCGLVVMVMDGTLKVIPCTNVAVDPTNEFEIEQSEFIHHSRGSNVCFIYHSHPSGGGISEADVENAEESALIQWVYDVPASRWHEYIPTSYEAPPLTGRVFSWGWRDCYALIRDFARTEFKTYVRDYPRDEDTDPTDIGKIVMENVDREGFEILPASTPPQVNDVLVLNTFGAPQHFAVFKGNSMMLHHPLGCLSRLDQYTTAWQRRLERVCRFKGVPV